MKRFLKSSLSFFLAITIIFSSAYVGLNELDLSGGFEVKAEAASESDLTFTLNDDGESYSVTDCLKSASGRIVIPSLYNSKPVTIIGVKAFEDCAKLTAITIPDSVTSIGDEAFCYCSSLRSITIPDSVTSIGRVAFHCTDYYSDSENWDNNVLYIDNHLIEAGSELSEEYVIKEETKTIADYAFSFCTSLRSITIPDSVTSIGDEAFCHCYSLKSVSIGDSVTSIGDDAFMYCSNLTSITIPDSVTSIGDNAFLDCESLTLVSIGDNVTSIGDGVFYYCGSLRSITIPDSVTSIGDNAFSDCTNLTSITIPDNVTSIGSSAFYNCDSLTSVTIGSGVTSIGKSAFFSCNCLEKIYWNAKNVKGFTKNSGILYYAGIDGAGIEMVFGDAVEKIPTNLCSESYPKIVSVTIGSGVTSIGKSAFSSCNCLEKIYWNAKNVEDFTKDSEILYYAGIDGAGIEMVFGDTVEKIPAYLCSGSYPKITSVTIGNGVKSIGSYAFDCSSLASITISDNVKYISNTAFCDTAYYRNNDNWENDMLYIGNHLIEVKGESYKYIIKDGTKTIARYAFSDCKEWVNFSVVIPNSVIYIGDYALYVYNSPYYSLAEDIFYEGTKDEWGNIEFGDGFANSENWKKLHYESNDHTASDWFIDKAATVYGTGKKHKECTQCGLTLETETIPQLKCSEAKLSKISNTSSGVKITWGKVTGADSYRVYRKTKDGSWKYLGSTSKASYTDKTAKSGTTYYYAVKVRNEAGDTDYSNSLSIKRLSTPKLSTVANTSSGIKVSWKKVTGASGYIVYRKTKSGDWKEIGKTSKLYYTDKKAKSGTSYYYSIRAYSGSSKSYYDTDGLSIRRLVAPKISSATSKREGILLKWNKITGASGYYVYRKASSGEWKKIATVKGNTKIKYLDETPRKGATYQYRVKAYYSKSTSANSNTYKIKCKY